MGNRFDKKKLADSFRTRSFRAGGYSVLAAALVIAIAVVVNLMAAKLPKTDLSSQELFTLSDQTVELAEGLDEPVTVYWLVSQGSEDSYLTQLLDRYDHLSQNLTVEKVDPVVYPTFASNYTDEEITMNSMILVSEKRSCYVSYESLYQYDYSTYASPGSYGVQFAGESEVTRALDYVTSDSLARAAVITGHGEVALSGTFSAALRSLNLETETLDLLTVEKVPEGTDCVLIYAPAQDLSESERDVLLAYLAGGGSVMLVTDCEVGEEFVNLNAVTGAYGMTAQSGILVEGDGDHCLSSYPYYLIPELGDHAITRPLSEGGYRMIAPFAGGLSIAEELPQGVTVTALLSTTEDAFSKAEGLLASTVEQEVGDTPGPFTVAAAMSDETTGARMVWLGSAMVLDEETNAISAGANEDFFLNAMAWMCGHESAISIHPKQLDTNTLTVSAADASRLTVVLCFVIPALFVITGAVVVIRRRRR